MTDIDLSNQIPLPWQSTQWRRLRLQFNDNQLAHAYLLAGPGGLGKAEFAKQFARIVVDGESASREDDKRTLGKPGLHPDIVLVEPEEGARDIKIDQIRSLADFLTKTSHAGGAKIAIIDHAHQMNNNAANALLKTLEEPTPGSYLFLISDSPGSLSATIRSRCQKLQFQSPDFDQASDWLQPLIGSEHDSVKLLVAANNRPLFALELAGDGNLHAREDFIQSLCSALTTEQPVQALVSEALKLGESTAIECLLETSAILIKSIAALSGNETKDAKDIRDPRSEFNGLFPDLLNLAGKLHSNGNAKNNLRQLSEFHQESKDSWGLLRSGANPNPQLIIESLLWHWRNMALVF